MYKTIVIGNEIIYNENCEILCKRSHSYCLQQRHKLSVRRMRAAKQMTSKSDPSSNAPYSALSRDEIKQRMKNLHNKV